MLLRYYDAQQRFQGIQAAEPHRVGYVNANETLSLGSSPSFFALL